jgi:nicotinamide-nucleotide amidase
MRAQQRRLAIAESCTGGRVAAALTSVPGSSQSFVGAVVAYDNAVKMSQLGVDAATLERHGAVSDEVAREMARGARARLGADVALATTGVAGPDGGTAEKPVGLVLFALDDGTENSRVWIFNIEGGREAIQQRATMIALNLLWRYARGQEP